VPSLAIGTLVENAIKHGIGPRESGGNLGISARLAHGRLMVEVRDDGVGFQARAGHGIGLANIRAQLATAFHERAALELAANADGGVTASLALPCTFA
jgi:LytS/YehU family sensor histidine kinase